MNDIGWSRGLKAASTLFVALLLIWGVMAATNDVKVSNPFTHSSVAGAKSDVAAGVKNDASNGAVLDDCEPQFAQEDITDPSLNRFVRGGIDAKTAIKSRDKLLSAVGHDASSVKFYARTFGMKNLPSESDMLTADKSCLSEAGQQVHHDLSVVMNASGVKFGQAPSDAYNSGVNKDGLPVIDANPGIRGNKKALVVTLPDGSKAILLVRCANPVFPSPLRDIPRGPTDNPKPPKTPKTPPHKACPPGQVGTPPYCLVPKSSKARDYPYPSGKPKVTSPGTVRSTPHPVKTSQPGGGGVVDTPTKKPGSETGVTAPGATKPGPERTTTPPNQGGTVAGNDRVDP